MERKERQGSAATTRYAARVSCLLPLLFAAAGTAQMPSRMEARVPPVQEGKWLRPATTGSAEPVWGIAGGIRVGLWPTPGPRGLFRIYAPYLGQDRLRMVNFVSVEPVSNGTRGQSELEVGLESGRRGLSFRTGDDLAAAVAATDASPPARGRLVREDGHEALTFFASPEPFRNGSQPVIQVILRADRPREIGFRLFAAPRTARMNACVLSATMGNYGRLRRLWLRDEVIEAHNLWPEFSPDPLGFAPWRQWDRKHLLRRDGSLLVAAVTDETDPAKATYDPAAAAGWHYQGRPATHYWRAPDQPGTVARVNARTTYWGSRAAIPGGIAFENFETEAPFQEGQEFWFGVTPEPPPALGFPGKGS